MIIAKMRTNKLVFLVVNSSSAVLIAGLYAVTNQTLSLGFAIGCSTPWTVTVIFKFLQNRLPWNHQIQSSFQTMEDASFFLWHSIQWASGLSVAKCLISPSQSCVSTSLI